jgi:hypothetical protein
MLLPHVRNLAKKYKEGKLDADEKAQLENALKIIGSAGTEEEMQAALLRGLGIADDLFVHWLQALAGRQIIVILDAPYASAFAPRQAAAEAGRPAAGGLAGGIAPSKPAWGGLANGITRLKALGQQEIALLGASTTDAADVARDPQGLSLMTRCLIQSLQQAAGPLDIEQAYREVGRAMEAHREPSGGQPGSAGRETTNGNRPLLVNSCARPALLKP